MPQPPREATADTRPARSVLAADRSARAWGHRLLLSIWCPAAATTVLAIVLLPWASNRFPDWMPVAMAVAWLALLVGGAWLLSRRIARALQHLHDDIGSLTGQLQASDEQAAMALRERDRERDALQAGNQSRARFLAAASHDLRQPLSALTLFSSALAQGETDPVRLTRIRHIRESVDSLDQLFTALLDLSRLEAGAVNPEPVAFGLDALFEEVSRTFRMNAEQRGLRLVVRKTDACVVSDRVMLARILNNLVSNAIRYTTEGGVLVGARHRGELIRIEVWDTGSGIFPEMQDQVFEEFFRVRGAPMQAGDSQGLGLGLSTVRRLTELLGIPITLRSRPGRGTVFSIEVPADETANGGPPLEPADLPLDVAGLCVFVIDDEPAILEGMRALLESWGCRVETAADADTALGLARHSVRPPDVVISDLQLGGPIDGIELIQTLDRHFAAQGGDRFARLLVTGASRQDYLQAAAAARIPALSKPVSPERLREAIVAAIALGRAS